MPDAAEASAEPGQAGPRGGFAARVSRRRPELTEPARAAVIKGCCPDHPFRVVARLDAPHVLASVRISGVPVAARKASSTAKDSARVAPSKMTSTTC